VVFEVKMKEFDDVVKFVDYIKNHPRSVISADDIEVDPPLLGFIDDDDNKFVISLENFQKSIKDYAPNNTKVVLFTNALKTEAGKNKLCEFFNKDKPPFNNKNTVLEQKTETDQYPEKDEVIDILDKQATNLLLIMSTLSHKTIQEWQENSGYGMLLTDVILGEGPKEMWLKIVIDYIKNNNGKLNNGDVE
jgi:hypothetical protein